MDENEIRRFLGDIDSITESAALLTEPTEISSSMDLTEIRRFLGETGV